MQNGRIEKNMISLKLLTDIHQRVECFNTINIKKNTNQILLSTLPVAFSGSNCSLNMCCIFITLVFHYHLLSSIHPSIHLFIHPFVIELYPEMLFMLFFLNIHTNAILPTLPGDVLWLTYWECRDKSLNTDNLIA